MRIPDEILTECHEHGVEAYPEESCGFIVGDLDDSVFSGLPFRTMPFYSGEPWFLPLAMKIYAVQDKFTTTTK